MRNAEREVFLFRRRLASSAVLVLVAFGGLFARFVYLQVFQHEHYQTLAETNRIAIVPIVPNRGVITDRNGVVLAQSYSAYTLELTPAQDQEPRGDDRRARDDRRHPAARPQALPQAPRRVEELREPAAAHAPVRRGSRRASPSIATASPASRSRRGCSASIRTAKSRRTWSATSAASPTRTSSASPTWDDGANYKGSDYIGKVGVELSYERELHGTTGVEEVEVDAGGRAVRTLSRTPPMSGNNLRAVARHQAAAGGREGVRRSARRAGRDRARAPATCSRSCRSPATIRTSSSTASTRELGGAQRVARQAAAQPAAARRVSAGLDDQAVPGARARSTSGKRTPQHAIYDPGFFQSAGIVVPLPRRQARRPRHGRHVQVDRRVLRHVLLHARERDRHRRHRALHDAARLRRRRPASTSRAS